MLVQKDLQVKNTEVLPIGTPKPTVFHFIWAQKNAQVAKNLLRYRYYQLDKAIDNAARNLGLMAEPLCIPW